MPTDLMTYMRVVRPGIRREEVAIALGVSVATLTRRLRDGLNADEVIRAAQHMGASPAGALIAVGLLDQADVDHAAAMQSLTSVSETALIDELAARAHRRQTATEQPRD